MRIFFRSFKQLGHRINNAFSLWHRAQPAEKSELSFAYRLFISIPLLRFFIYFITGWWILAGDPFGVSTASDRAVSAEVNRISSFFSPVRQAPITVVLIDFESIEGLHNDGAGWMAANDWPLTYSDHARILKDLVTREKDQQPAAIFYDIFFERPRVITGDMSRFGRQLSLIQTASGVPVYLAGGGSFMPMSDSSYEALGRPRLTATAWQGYGDYYPLHAPLTGSDAPSTLPKNAAPMPALAMYKELCRARGEACAWTDREDLPPQAIQWEVQNAEACGARVEGTSYGPVASTLLRIAHTLGIAVDVPEATAECLPVHQVRLASLYGESPESLRPPSLVAGEPYVVMVGVIMPSLKDYVASPLYGLVEGVFLHASALENLNRMDQDYIREKNIVIAALLVWGLAIFFVMYWYASYRNGFRKADLSKYQRGMAAKLALKAAWFAGFAALIVLIYLLLYRVFRISPDGWLGIIPLIPLMGEFVVSSEKLVNERFKADDE